MMFAITVSGRSASAMWTASRLALSGLVFALLGACSPDSQATDSDTRAKALALWQSHCKKSGEFIKKTIPDVDGVLLMKIRKTTNRDGQYELDDPYGHDSTGDHYIMSFLRGYHHQKGGVSPEGSPPRVGYKYVDVVDEIDQKVYRYTGGMKAVGRMDPKAPGVVFELNRNPTFDLNIYDYLLSKTPTSGEKSRYGVTYEDISTTEDRKYWIAGSSLSVIDLKTQEVIAERVGYMVDLGQGNRSGGRAPWLWAADNACPDFMRNTTSKSRDPKFSAQVSQTLDFVEKVLKPAK